MTKCGHGKSRLSCHIFVFYPADIYLAHHCKDSYIMLESLVGQRGREEDWVWNPLDRHEQRPTDAHICLPVPPSQKWMWITDSIDRWTSRTTFTTSLPSLFWWSELLGWLGMPWSCMPFSGKRLFFNARSNSEDVITIQPLVNDLTFHFLYT